MRAAARDERERLEDDPEKTPLDPKTVSLHAKANLRQIGTEHGEERASPSEVQRDTIAPVTLPRTGPFYFSKNGTPVLALAK
jgi:hypothetical protein